MSFSVNRALTLTGSSIGRTYCKDFLLGLGIKEDNLKTERSRSWKSFASIQKQQLTLNISSRSDGESFGESPTEQIMTLLSIWNIAANPLNTFDPEDNSKYIPYVIEPSLGVERLFLSYSYRSI